VLEKKLTYEQEALQLLHGENKLAGANKLYVEKERHRDGRKKMRLSSDPNPPR
jgi:hypothetical protein